MNKKGIIFGIFITPEAKGEIFEVENIEAVAGIGLKGDRNYYKQQRLSAEKRKPKHELTLVEWESVDELNQSGEFGVIKPEELRRNLVTKGVDLNSLVGKQFLVGDVRAEGLELCEPCRYLEKLTGKKIMKPLIHKAGLRAGILQDGIISKGDQVEILS
ncbi:MAG: MOSC domain-containing protein [Balneolaceae bacterium]